MRSDHGERGTGPLTGAARARQTGPRETPFPASRLTHAAFEVEDVDRTVAFYERFTQLRVVHERPDHRTGSKVVWMREPDGAPGALTIVLLKATGSASGTGPLHHLGFAVESRGAVDAIAARARAEGVLSLEPADHGDVVGYICTITDPDGDEIEFSYGQAL